MRLDKYLTECGCGTRSKVKVLLKSGVIKIDGKIEKSSKFNVDLEKNIVTFENKEIIYKEYRYYIMHKPAGVITATEDKYEKTVMDILPDWIITKNLVPVGRLDKDTEGLLLFTNNGKLNHNLLSPKNHVKKTYYVELEKNISSEDIECLETGVKISNDYITKEAQIKKVSDKIIHLTIVEGKFHQVKEMLKSVNNKVTYLKRLTFGNLKLGNLTKGEVIEIELEDII